MMITSVRRLVYCIILGSWLFWQAPVYSASDVLAVNFFGSGTCEQCVDLRERLAQFIGEEYAGRVCFYQHDIDTPSMYALLMRYEHAYGVESDAALHVFIGDRVLSGKESISRDYAAVIDDCLRRGARGPALLSADDQPPLPRISAWAVCAAALVDGINPCAFTVIIFIVALLTQLRRSAGQIVLAGIAFSAGIFCAYMALGVAALAALRALFRDAGWHILLARGMAVASLILALLCLRDARGLMPSVNAAKPRLCLPFPLQKRINRLASQAGRSRWFIAALFGAGLIIALLESACTGQIYVPTLLYMARQGSVAQALPYLVLYNIVFILPVWLVFAAAGLGLRSETVRRWFAQYRVLLRLLLAGVFIGLAFLLWK